MNTITYQKFIIYVPTFNIKKTFDDKDSALAFANHLAIDFPNAKINRFIHTQTIDYLNEPVCGGGDDQSI